jgi:hypothetical protein
MEKVTFLDDGNINRTPNDIDLICDDIYELGVLVRMFRYANNGWCKPLQSFVASFATLSMSKNIMSEISAKRAVKSLESKGYVSHVSHGYQSNEYTLNLDKIRQDIIHKMPMSELAKEAAREFSEAQKVEMSKKTINKLGSKQDVVDLAYSKDVTLVVDNNTGEILEPKKKSKAKPKTKRKTKKKKPPKNP